MMTMLSVMDTLEQTNSTKEKERLLRENQSADLKEYLNIALNPYRVYYVSKFPTKKVGEAEAVAIAGKGFTNFKNLVKKLECREISGHTALNTIVDAFRNYSAKERKWYEKALTKKAIGVGAKIVNKALGNVVPEFEVMLADNKQPDINKIKYPMLVQAKLDGFRAVYIPNIGLMGRNGKKIRNERLADHFSDLYRTLDYVFDGELYSHDRNFNELASVLNSEDKEIPADVRYHVYDGMGLQCWDEKKCQVGYSKRLDVLRNRVSNFKYATIVPVLKAENTDKVKQVYSFFLNAGYEGIMLKDPDGLYQWKRVRLSSQTMLKLKPSVTHDLEVTGFVEGEGKLAGSLGKLLVDFQGKEVGVGTGFTESQREVIWKHKDDTVGRIVEVKAMEVTPDGSLRHPVFVRFREDKE
jgi:DNA ligase-1